MLARHILEASNISVLAMEYEHYTVYRVSTVEPQQVERYLAKNL